MALFVTFGTLERLFLLKCSILNKKSWNWLKSCYFKKWICKLSPKKCYFWKRKKATLILKAKPREDNLKRNTKNRFSILWSRILVDFKIGHITPWLVRLWFWLFFNFLRLRRERFDLKTLNLRIEVWYQKASLQTLAIAYSTK